jgi:ribonucleoside-diphosphate reductase beta chain
MPQEVNIQRDIELWKNPNGLTEDDRRIFKRNQGFFVTADWLASNKIVLGTCRHILINTIKMENPQVWTAEFKEGIK